MKTTIIKIRILRNRIFDYIFSIKFKYRLLINRISITKSYRFKIGFLPQLKCRDPDYKVYTLRFTLGYRTIVINTWDSISYHSGW